eukprot:5704052-Amphidinium_carterae.1
MGGGSVSSGFHKFGATKVQRSGKWKRWVLPWTTMGLKRRESTDVLDDQQTLLTEDDEWS